MSDFILLLDEHSLVGIREYIIKIKVKNERLIAELNSYQQEEVLSSINVLQFCHGILCYIQGLDTIMHETNVVTNWSGLVTAVEAFRYESFKKQVFLLCQLFDAVDVDNNGVISWIDLTSYCVRLGRLQHTPTLRFGGASYVINLEASSPFTAAKLYFDESTGRLYGLSSEFSVVRVWLTTGEYSMKFDPIADLRRRIRIENQGKSEKEVVNEVDTVNDSGLYNTKVAPVVLCMVAVPRLRILVLCTSDNYIISCDIMKYRHLSRNETPDPQIGIVYSPNIDLLISWSDGQANCTFKVWNPSDLRLRYVITRHSNVILSACVLALSFKGEANQDWMASSSIDRDVAIWPLSSVKSMLQDTDFHNSKSFQKSKSEKYLLSGHKFSIKSLAYAPEHMLLLGAGFDYDLYAWNPLTRELVYQLQSHVNSLLNVVVVNIPNERAVTVDTGGILKLWSLDPLQSGQSHCLQTLDLHIDSVYMQVIHTTAAFDQGNVIALVETAEVHFIHIDSDSNVKYEQPLPKSIVMCEKWGKISHFTGKTVSLTDFKNGQLKKCFNIFHSDIHEPLHRHLMAYESAHGILHHGIDHVTAVTSDLLGKKIFIGTAEGHVKMYDSSTYGLLDILTFTSEQMVDDVGHHQGAVAALQYLDEYKLVVCVYRLGAIKVLRGIYRGSKKEYLDSNITCLYEEVNSENEPRGGKVIRECDYHINHEIITDLAVHCRYELIAVSTKNGYVIVYDLATLKLVHMLKLHDNSDVAVDCVGVCFTPDFPVLLHFDSIGRITAWSVRPLEPKWIITWCPQQIFRAFDEGYQKRTSRSFMMTANPNGDEAAYINSIIHAKSNSFIGTGPAITCLECVVSHESTPVEVDPTVSTKQDTEASNKTRKSFASRRRSSASVVSNHEEEIKKLNKLSNLGHRRWYVLVGDALGHMHKLEITKIIALTARNSSNDYRVYAPHANIYTTFPRRVDIHIGLKQGEVEAVDHMLKAPTGINNTIQIQGSYGVSAQSDIAPLSKWYTHSEGVVSIKCVQDNRCYFNINEKGRYYMVANQIICPSTPICIVTINMTGVLHTWSWDGEELGESVDIELQKQSSVDINRKQWGWKIPIPTTCLDLAIEQYREYRSSKVQRSKSVDTTVEVEVSTEVKKSMDYMEALIHYIMHHVNSHSKVDSHIAANRQYGSDYSTVVCSDVISLIGGEDKYSKWKQVLSDEVLDSNGTQVRLGASNDALQERLIQHTLRDPSCDITKKRPRKVTLHCINYNEETAHKAVLQGLGDEKELTFLEKKLIEDIQHFKDSGGMRHSPNKWEIALEKRKKERPVSAYASPKKKSGVDAVISPINTQNRPKSANSFTKSSENLTKMRSILSLFDSMNVSGGGSTTDLLDARSTYSPLKLPGLSTSPLRTSPAVSPKAAYNNQQTIQLVEKVTNLIQDKSSTPFVIPAGNTLPLKGNNNKRFDDIVVYNDIVEEKFREDIPNFAFKRGRYGSYKSKDIYILVNLLSTLFKSNDSLDTDPSTLQYIDDSYVFPIDLLLTHPEIKMSNILTSAIEAQPVDYFDRSLNKKTIIKVICPFATDAELNRICTYVRICELLKWMFYYTNPPKKSKKNTNLFKKTVTNQSSNKVTVEKAMVPELSGPVYLPVPVLSQLNFSQILTDGFTNWTIKNYAYREFIHYIGKWKKDKNGTITCQDMIDTILALLPSKFSSNCKQMVQLAQKMKALYDLNDEIDEVMMGALLKNLLGFVVVVDNEKKQR